MVYIDRSERQREKEKKRKRESEGLKARDEERQCRAIFGPSGCFLHTHTLTLLRVVVVQNGGC